MKMYFKYFIMILAVSLTNCTGSGSSSEAHERKHKEKIYTCPMHPEIIRNKPGLCPVCGMDLVEKKDQGEMIEDTQLVLLLKPTNEYVVSKVKTITPIYKEISVQVPVTGKITYDTREVNTISSRVSGRVDKLYLKYGYQPIKKGDKLMEIYSRELVTEQENLLYIMANDAGNQPLISAAENKLRLMGLSDDEIEKVKRSRKSYTTITIYSSYSGHLHVLNNEPPNNNTMSSEQPMNSEMQVKEGMYVEKGQSLFNIYNTNKVWALLNIYPENQQIVGKGAKVVLSVDTDPQEELVAKIDFVEPILQAGQKTISARVYLNNDSGTLKIGSLVKGNIQASNVNGFFLPSTAVLNLGKNTVAFFKEGNAFKAKIINTGLYIGNWVQVLSGATKSDSVAENAQLLIDSESFIKTDVR